MLITQNLNTKRKNKSTSKWTNDQEKHFTKEVQMASKCKTIFIIVSHKSNANQNHTEIL
jgi:hypothetical protein